MGGRYSTAGPTTPLRPRDGLIGAPVAPIVLPDQRAPPRTYQFRYRSVPERVLRLLFDVGPRRRRLLGLGCPRRHIDRPRELHRGRGRLAPGREQRVAFDPPDPLLARVGDGHRGEQPAGVG